MSSYSGTYQPGGSYASSGGGGMSGGGGGGGTALMVMGKIMNAVGNYRSAATLADAYGQSAASVDWLKARHKDEARYEVWRTNLMRDRVVGAETERLATAGVETTSGGPLDFITDTSREWVLEQLAQERNARVQTKLMTDKAANLRVAEGKARSAAQLGIVRGLLS